MKKVIILTVCLLTISCKESSYKNKGQSSWVVGRIGNESSTTSTYFAKTTDTTDLNERSTWFADSVGAFQVGDTLIFTQKR